MLGKTAGGLLWMARYLERSENMARLVETGLRIALTRSSSAEDEWASIIATAAASDRFVAAGHRYESGDAIDFLLRAGDNPSSVCAALTAARNNARLVRTALTREAWEAINVCWMTVTDALKQSVEPTEVPSLLSLVRQQCALVRGAMQGSLLRNEIYNFIRIGTFLERADNTLRILDVKYYVLLPEIAYVGSSLDNVQWETILRAASADRSFGWLHGGEISPAEIASFLIFDSRMPRSLAFCYAEITENLGRMARDSASASTSTGMATDMLNRLRHLSINDVFEIGLHQFIASFIRNNAVLATTIEREFRFYE